MCIIFYVICLAHLGTLGTPSHVLVLFFKVALVRIFA